MKHLLSFMILYLMLPFGSSSSQSNDFRLQKFKGAPFSVEPMRNSEDTTGPYKPDSMFHFIENFWTNTGSVIAIAGGLSGYVGYNIIVAKEGDLFYARRESGQEFGIKLFLVGVGLFLISLAFLAFGTRKRKTKVFLSKESSGSINRNVQFDKLTSIGLRIAISINVSNK